MTLCDKTSAHNNLVLVSGKFSIALVEIAGAWIVLRVKKKNPD